MNFLLPNGRKVEINPLTFGRARLSVVDPHCPLLYDDEW